ncbi:MAG: C39 family peptidase, partial [Candidatus Eremiobacteraeota bacterium]|nr:C39 family peptidase [Candidatus Eremiobacteraeota bacterium]
MALIFDAKPRARAVLRCPPARRGVISWNTSIPEGSIAVRARFTDESWSASLPYVSWNSASRVSLGGRDARAHFEVDVLLTSQPFNAIEADASTKLDAFALATPPEGEPQDRPLAPIELDVPRLSQYAGDPGRGWCSPASLAMLLGANGIGLDVPVAAAAIYDDAYHGTGNWAFNVAFASRLGLRAFVAYLRDLAHARLFLEQGVPIALSIAWKAGELRDPPLPESDGHILVLRGFDEHGDPIVNDPAQPTIRVVYPRTQFQQL